MNQPHDIQLKIATPGDAPGLLSVYAPYVENTVITFEYELPTAEEFAARIRHTLERYPWLMATAGDEILGYAYASPFKDRAAYVWSAETSIYVREDAKGQGIGSALYRTLESALYRQHICNLCACIAHPHPESELFHKRFGYRQTAHFHRSGYKSGHWIDMIWMEKELYPHETPPEPFIPFPLIGFDPERVES